MPAAEPNGASDAEAEECRSIEALHARCTAGLRRHVRRYASNDADLDDLLQEIWLRAIERRITYRATGTPEGWMLRFARSVCLDRYRSESARARTWQTFMPALAETLLVRPPEHEAIEAAEESDAREDVMMDALVALPPRARAVATARLLLDRPTNDVAAMLQMAPGTVKATLHHAKQQLRKVLTDRSDVAA